ncbi:YciI family protein [soil metagenome]
MVASQTPGAPQMKYALLFTETDSKFAERSDAKKAEPYRAAWGAYIGAIHQAGIVVAGSGLEPPHTATTIRIRDGKRDVQDGPYADAKEQLGGFFVIDVPHLDAALEWAARSPSASYGAVEVRPVMVMPA